MAVVIFPPRAEFSVTNHMLCDAMGMLKVENIRVTIKAILNACEAGTSAEEITHNSDALALLQVYSVCESLLPCSTRKTWNYIS